MSDSVFEFDSRLDREFLESVYEGDLEHAETIFKQFVDLTPKQMNEIEDSYHSGELSAFREKIHKVKPIFSFVGLTEMTSQAEMLERKCKEISNINELANLYQHFRSNYTDFFPVIENEFNRLKA